MGIGRALLIRCGPLLLAVALALLRQPYLEAGRGLATGYARWIVARPRIVEGWITAANVGVLLFLTVAISRQHATPQSFQEAGHTGALIAGLLFALALLVLRKSVARCSVCRQENLLERPGPAWPYLVVLLFLAFMGIEALLVGCAGYQRA